MDVHTFDVEYLRECFDFRAEEGALYWRKRPVTHFRDDGQMRSWNTRYAGKPALNNVSHYGYRVGAINNISGIKAHRIIWAMATGSNPAEIDHINGDRSDNRLTNLRAVDRTANMRNAARPSHNTSGHIGVGRFRGKWRAFIKADQRYIHLGVFKTLDAAIARRKAAEAEHGFHQNHGRAA